MKFRDLAPHEQAALGTMAEAWTEGEEGMAPDDELSDGDSGKILLAGLNAGIDAMDAGLRAENARLRARLKEAREALKSIAESPHCDYGHTACAADGAQYRIGVADGHRCAANDARAFLAGDDGT